MDVDLQLGAKFAGVIKREFQDRTVQLLIQKINAPKILRYARRKSGLTKQNLVEELEKCLGQSIDSLKIQPIEKSKFLQFLEFLQLFPIEVVEKPIKSDGMRAGSVRNRKDMDARRIDNFYADLYGYEYQYQAMEQDRIMFGALKVPEGDEPFIRRKACEPVETLITKLKNENAWERRNTVEALDRIGGDKVVSPLIQILGKDRDAEVRQYAAEALGRIGSEIAIPALLKRLEDSALDVRWEATDALEKLAKKYPEAIASRLPHFLTLICTNSGKQALKLIPIIQTNCKFYNYSIHKAKLKSQHGNQKVVAQEATTVFNIGTLHAPGAAINLGGTIQGDQIGTQPHPPEP